MGMVKPEPGFLQGLRDLCDEYGSVLFFDEVITGFRVGLGGAQELYDVLPDMSAFGKVIGSGLPVGAYGGRSEIMDWVAPSGPVYQAGTLSGNPLAMAAGKAAFDLLAEPGFYDALEEKGAYFEGLIRPILEKHGHPAHFERQGSLFYMWFKEKPAGAPRNYDEIKTGSPEKYGKFFWELMNRGVYLAPSAFEVGFISAAHQTSDLDFAAKVIDEAFAAIA
jgi:glutamate-1-semialdehyde 2,1-aminomutase